MKTRQKLRHIRAKDRDGNILSKGGATISAMVDENDIVVEFAVAYCHSRDNFNRRTGKVKANGRMQAHVNGVGEAWSDVVDSVTREVRALQQISIHREIEKLDAKRQSLDRRITALSTQYQNV
jgi:hypothetical protein